MSKDTEIKIDSTEQLPAVQPEPTLGRRLFFFKAAAVLGGAAVVTAAVSVATSTPAHAQCTDRDPYDGRGRGIRCRRRWRCTDRDPYDGRGRGIRC